MYGSILPGPTAQLWPSTAIEGNTLVLREVERLLDEGQTVGAKPLRDYLEVQGYGDAAKWVYGQAVAPGDWAAEELVTLQEIRHIHHVCMTPVWTVAPHPHATGQEGPATSDNTKSPSSLVA